MSLLETESLSKSFGGVRAVDRLHLSIAEGEIVGLIGPNGAGKSTCLDLLTGFIWPDAGTIRLFGRIVTGLKPFELAQYRLARTFQQVQVFPSLPPLQAVLTAAYRRAPDGFWWRLAHPRVAKRQLGALRDEACELLRSVGVDPTYEGRTGDLPYGMQKMTGLAMALITRPRVLLLDEPAAGLNPAEKALLHGLLRRLQAQGVTQLIVDHDMKFIMSLCNRIVVLHHGQKIAEGTPDAVAADPTVVEAYLGFAEEAVS